MAIVGLVVEIQRRDLDQPDPLGGVGVGRTGEDVDLMAPPGEGLGGLAQIDPLAADPRVRAIGKEGDAQGTRGRIRRAGVRLRDADGSGKGLQHRRCP